MLRIGKDRERQRERESVYTLRKEPLSIAYRTHKYIHIYMSKYVRKRKVLGVYCEKIVVCQ